MRERSSFLTSSNAIARRLSWLALLLVSGGCSSSNSSPTSVARSADAAPEAPGDGLDFSAFDSVVNAFLTEKGFGGASAVVVQKDLGIVHERGYGRFAADRVYLIASSSKVMSVGILMRLADEGKLDINAPISNYLSAFGTYKSDISVAQLVSNSSGLVSLIDNPLYGPYLCQYLRAGTLTDCAKTIYTADDSADRHPPDTKFDYGGGAWQLAGGIAEVVSGEPWAQLVKEAYVDPCGVRSIAYNNHYQQAFSTGDAGLTGAFSYPPFFQGDAGVLAPTQNPSIEGGAYTTAHDYGKILLMHLREGVCDGGRVLSKASVDLMQQDRIGQVYGGTTTDPNFQGYGLGWWVDRQDRGVVADPGAYGAVPWLDVPRKYAAMILLEATTADGSDLLQRAKPSLDAIFGPLAGDAGTSTAPPLDSGTNVTAALDAAAEGTDASAPDASIADAGDASTE
jgi:CubicO group peptidase (beta-lactamase class C family)